MESQRMTSYEARASDVFGDYCINKALVDHAGFGTRSIPAFVGEWIISRHAPDGILDDAARERIRTFLDRHLPTRDQKEQLKARAMSGEQLTLLDQFAVTVNLARNEYRLSIPCLDEQRATIDPALTETYPLLLGSGVWGVGKLRYERPQQAGSRDGHLRLVDFRPMQNARLDLDLIAQARQQFSLDEWRDLMVASMGYDPQGYSLVEQTHLLTRLVPLVQERINLVELAPKGTGKSFVFLNMSRRVRLVSGGRITAPQLFYNHASQQPGLLVNYDVVVLDEAQSLDFDNPGEVIGILKDYLESGAFSRGGKKFEASSGLVLLANIPITAERRPRDENLFRELPEFLGETAFIDRIHGILPGWELPRIDARHICRGIGLKADFFGDLLHGLRGRAGYEMLFGEHANVDSIADRRDLTAIRRLATGLCKLLFPHGVVERELYREHCLRPAVALRQRVRDQLALLDEEYPRVTIQA
jgi:ATP-dependent Lon protease